MGSNQNDTCANQHHAIFGLETNSFKEFEQLITGAISCRDCSRQKPNLIGDALRYFLTLPEVSRLIFADSITALRNIFNQDDLREINNKVRESKVQPKVRYNEKFLMNRSQ